MPRMMAPEGVTNYSHNGHAFDIADDGVVDVDDKVAGILSAHGFKHVDVAAPPSETVSVKRDDLLAVLEMMGAAANPAMRADKLSAALTAAVKARREKAEKKGVDQQGRGVSSS